MALVPIRLPPGIYRAGTAYQSKGRWHDGNLVRFIAGTIQPVGGWRSKAALPSDPGKARAILTWTANNSTAWTAIGTHARLFAMTRGGTVSDITPDGFTAGRADAQAAGGYGGGAYGEDEYGVPRPDTSQVQEASMWSLDSWGEKLIGVMAQDGIIYEWALDPDEPAAAVENAPSAAALLVTQEGILMALAAELNPRRVKWSDQRDNTVWTPDATNQAGDFDLQTNGRLLQGLKVRGGNILLTDLGAWLASYTGDELVYRFDKLADGCGAVSRGAAIAIDAQAVWMGANNFWLYNGFVAPLPCEVWDHVFADINRQQLSKVTCELSAAFGEVTWRYPSGGSLEIDRFVTWSFRENHWTIGSMARLCGIDAGVMQYPLRVDAAGAVHEHEVGYAYDGVMPFLEGGPLELGNGDSIAYAQALLPDDRTLGEVSASFRIKFEPDGEETSFGPYTLARRTDLRFGGRQIKIRFDGVANAPWRIGEPRLELVTGGLR
ncbi:MAG TPA: hypothetical protein VJ798_02040 [Rhizomicrobium sp.]|nr:hypothetical protein [Rhizomicrobium sp.]